jgi:hypothetical protein
LAGAGTNTEAGAAGDPLRRQGERRMSSRESLPVPFFTGGELHAKRAEASSRMVSGTAGCGGFILQGAKEVFLF